MITEITFNNQKNGYDKTQVNNYVQKIAEAYQKMYEEHTAICEKYDNLLQDYKKLEEQNQNAVATSTEMIAKTLIDTEKLAKRIVGNARKEEARVMALTAKSLESAYFALEQAMDTIGLEAQKFLNTGTENNVEPEPNTNENPGEIEIEKEGKK